jgi:PAS domain S-box-containing protein
MGPSEKKMDRPAAEGAAAQLDGTPADPIPGGPSPPSAPIFDDRERRRPPGGFYHRRSGGAWTTAALCGVLLILVAALLLSIQRRAKTAAALRRGREALEEKIQERTRELDRINRELRREIAERRETEAALTENEIKFRGIFHLSPQPVALAEPETGRILDANDRLCRLTGFARDELVGRTSVEIGLLDQEQRDRFYQELRQNDQVEGMEMTFHVRDGSTRDLLMFSRIINLVGRPTILTILVDVTRRNLLEQRLQRRRRMEAVATLAGGIAHQFNNAVYGIIGNVDLLRLKYPEDPVLNRHLRAMKDVSGRMSRLTSQLLAYTRGGAFNLKVTPAGEILADTLSILEHEVPETVRLETTPAPGGTFLEVDTPQFQMALSAVVTNALEAMANDEGVLRVGAKLVTVDAETAPEAVPGDYLRISVIDTGRGMSPEIRTRMFEPFFTTHFHGRGLGMAAVYGILRSHGGWIRVDSVQGRGTRVDLYFPRVPAPAAPMSTPRRPPTGGTILVVEDDPAVMAVTEEMLAHLGYRVLKSETGGGAVDLVTDAGGEVDLVLLDIILPDMTGGEVFQRLRALWPELKVLLASGHAEDGPARAILDNGADGFIQKPYALSTLTRKLTEVMAA